MVSKLAWRWMSLSRLMMCKVWVVCVASWQSCELCVMRRIFLNSSQLSCSLSYVGIVQKYLILHVCFWNVLSLIPVNKGSTYTKKEVINIRDIIWHDSAAFTIRNQNTFTHINGASLIYYIIFTAPKIPDLCCILCKCKDCDCTAHAEYSSWYFVFCKVFHHTGWHQVAT